MWKRTVFKNCQSATVFLILPFKLEYNILYNILNISISKKMDLVVLFLHCIENSVVCCKGWGAENVVLIGFRDDKATRDVLFVTPAVRAHTRNQVKECNSQSYHGSCCKLHSPNHFRDETVTAENSRV